MSEASWRDIDLGELRRFRHTRGDDGQFPDLQATAIHFGASKVDIDLALNAMLGRSPEYAAARLHQFHDRARP